MLIMCLMIVVVENRIKVSEFHMLDDTAKFFDFLPSMPLLALIFFHLHREYKHKYSTEDQKEYSCFETCGSRRICLTWWS